MKRRKITTLAKAGRECRSVTMSLLIDGMEFIDFSGLKALNILIGPNEGISGKIEERTISIIPRRATMKSIQFHPSLK